MARVQLLPAADADIADILAYLSQRAGNQIAAGYAQRFLGVVEKLSLFPGMGAPRPKLGRNIRILIEPPYVCIYRHEPEDTVIILRIVHGRRRISRRLLS